MRKFLSIFAVMLVALAVNAQTDFAAPGYSCAADDAVLTGGSASHFYLQAEAEPHYVAWADCALSENALATWTVSASRGCYVTVSLDLGPVIASNKHNFEVTIKDASGNVKGMLTEGGENTASEQVKALDGTILMPAAGTYTVEVYNNRDWGKGSIKNVILTYAADAPAELIPVSGIELNKPVLELEVAEVEQLIATVSPEDAFDPSVTWVSSDETVVTVVDGFVSAIAAGTATITATAGEMSATCPVTVAAVTIPSSDFAEPFALTAKKAMLEGAIWKMYKDETYKLYGDGGHNKNYGTAIWNLNVTKACSVTAVLNGVEGGHTFVLDLYNGEELVASLNQPDGATWSAGEIAMDGSLTFAAAGNYILKLRNTQEWSSGKVAGVTLTIVPEPGEPVAIYLAPAMWTEANAKFGVYAFQDGLPEYFSDFMALAENETAIYTTTIPANYGNVVFMRLNDGATEVAWNQIWNQTEDMQIQEGMDMLTITSWSDGADGKSTGAWSKYEPSAPAEMTTIYDWAGEVGTTILGTTGVEISTVKIHENTDAIPGIKFGSSYVYADGKYIAIKPVEGGFKAGDVLSVAAVFNNANENNDKYAQIDLRAANGDTRIWLSDSASTINGRLVGDEPIVQTYTLEADQDSLFLGRYGNTGMFITLLKVERAAGDEPQPQECDWDAIDFLGDGSPEQSFGNQFKVCKAGDQPNVVNIQKPNFAAETGIYVTFPSAVFGEISLAEGQYVIEGAGMVLYLSAFTQEYTEVTVNWDGNDIIFTVYNAAAAPQPVEHTYTVAGGSAELFGTTWDPANAANDMTKLEDGTYKLEKTEITLPAGNVEFKVCEDHAWTVCYPAENYQLVIPEAGVYTITITYNPEGNVVAADQVKTGDAVVDPVVSIAGSMNSWNASADVMTLAEDKATASITLNLAAQTYEFKVVLNGSEWRSNAQELTRENATAAEMTGNLDNMHLVADVAGEYVFTWTFATNTLAITFPRGEGIDNTAVDVKAVKMIENGQLFIELNGVRYNVTGARVR